MAAREVGLISQKSKLAESIRYALTRWEGPEFRREVQPPASLNGLDVPSRRAVFVPWKPSRRRGFGMGTRLSVEEPMLSTGLHLASESTGLTRFLDDGQIEIDSNTSRTLNPIHRY